LKIGERIKALRSGFKEYLRELANHRLFELDQHRFRDSNWNLAAQFFKASYTGNPVARVEFAELKDFLLGPVDDSKAQKAKDRANRVMTFELKTINEALTARPSFEEYLSSARTLKWLFAALSQLIDCYSLTGKEHLVARGVLEYYDAKARESSPEWTSYFGAGRTGRMDTDDVKACLNQLSQYMVNSANAHPLDTNRWFTAEQRDQIWHTSGESCRICHIKLSRSNFHADHIQPHSEGGRTTVENGQALCAACNLRKGRDTMFPSELR
jgi:hypothetical protein